MLVYIAPTFYDVLRVVAYVACVPQALKSSMSHPKNQKVVLGNSVYMGIGMGNTYA